MRTTLTRFRSALTGMIQRRFDRATDALNHVNGEWRQTEYWRGYEAGYHDGKDITEMKLLGNGRES